MINNIKKLRKKQLSYDVKKRREEEANKKQQNSSTSSSSLTSAENNKEDDTNERKLFDVTLEPHEQSNIAVEEGDLVNVYEGAIISNVLNKKNTFQLFSQFIFFHLYLYLFSIV